MTPSKTPKSRRKATDAEKAASAEKRRDTIARNANLTIDFTAGKDEDELTVPAARRSSLWVDRLRELQEGIERGEGEVGKFYPIGEFDDPAGARNIIRGFQKNPDRLPGVFSLHPEVVGVGAQRRSILMAAVPE